MDKKEYYYDAFISYRHTELDIFVAESLHKILERYRVPKRIQETSGKKKIARIFRDRDELPLSADLAENIKSALEQSEYLIVVCSPEAVESAWVQREIQVFLETHDKRNVLTILANGEPAQAFPEILCFDEKKIVTEDGEDKIVREMVEPLAADVRGATKEEVYKKLKQESLRILAPLLSCTYDDLRQRHKEYAMRRTLMAAGVCTVLALAFTIYALYQNAQIQKQYDQALINESQYLLEKSAQLLEEGDREGALQLALDAAPSEEMDRPLVPEVMYALNNALYSYQNEGRIYFCADKMVKTDSRTWDSGRFSEEGTYYFNFDESGIAYVYESATGDEIWKFRPSDLDGVHDPVFVKGNFISDEQLILVTADTLVIVDVKEQTVENMIHTSMDMDVSDYIYTGEKYVLCQNTAVLVVFDMESGECLYREMLNDLELLDVVISWADWYGDKVAIGTQKRWSSTEKQELLILSVDTGELQRIETDEIVRTCFLDENTVATIEYVKEDYYSDEKWSYVRLYDLATGQRVWSSEGVYSYVSTYRHELQDFSMIPFGDGERHTVLAANIDDTLLLIEPYQQNEFVRVHYASQITGIGKYDAGRLMVGLADGSIWIQTMSNSTFANDSGKIANEVKQFAYHPQSQLAVQVVAGGNKTVFSRMSEDTSMTMHGDTEVGSFGYITCMSPEDETKTKAFRLIVPNTELETGIVERKVILQDMDTQEILVERSIGSSYLSYVNVFYVDEKAYFTILNSSGFGDDKEIVTIDLESGEEFAFAKEDDGHYSIHDSFGVEFAKTGFGAFYYRGSEFGLVDVLTGEDIIPCRAHLGSANIDRIQPLADRVHLAIFLQNLDTKEHMVKIWNIERQEEVASYLLESFDDDPNMDSRVAIGEKQNVMAHYGDEKVTILDLLTGEILQEIPFHGTSFCKIGFIDLDKYLLLYGDSRELVLWDMEEQKIGKSQELYFDGSIEIHSDSYGNYFGIKETSLITDAGMRHQPLHIFMLDEEQDAFYQYADVKKAITCFEYEEISCTDLSNIYYYGKMKTLEELRQQAEEVLK